MESNTQGCTLTGRGVTKVEISHDIGGIGQVISWEPLIIRVQCKWENWVELHQNPSYKSINRGLAKWALATCESMHAMGVVNVEVELR